MVLVARMLKDKGVGEFIEAARLLSDRGYDIRFTLVGAPDPQNPSSMTEAASDSTATACPIPTPRLGRPRSGC